MKIPHQRTIKTVEAKIGTNPHHTAAVLEKTVYHIIGKPVPFREGIQNCLIHRLCLEGQQPGQPKQVYEDGAPQE